MTFNYTDFKNNEQQDNRENEKKKKIKSTVNKRDSGRFDVGMVDTITRFVLERHIFKWP